MKSKVHRIRKRRSIIMPHITSISSLTLDVKLFNLYNELEKGIITPNKYMNELTRIKNEYFEAKVSVNRSDKICIL